MGLLKMIVLILCEYMIYNENYPNKLSRPAEVHLIIPSIGLFTYHVI